MIRAIMSQADVVKGLRIVNERIEAACKRRSKEFQKFTPRLVAVTKTKPKELIIAAYNEGQRHFGENYVKELVEKASDDEITKHCPDIRWHFIGHLQTNKVKKVIYAPNLYMIETVDTEKLAKAIDVAWQTYGHDDIKLKVMIQVNTSREEEKSGCTPEEAPSLTKFVVDNCKYLDVVGLMTIGKYDYDTSLGPNPDFLSLINVREEVAKTLNCSVDDLELSMGMTDDYEQAIELGSSSVRVGRAIFGYREIKTRTNNVDQISEDLKNTCV